MVSPLIEHELARLLDDIADVPKTTWLAITAVFAIPAAITYTQGYEFAAFLLGIMAVNAFAGFLAGVYRRW